MGANSNLDLGNGMSHRFTRHQIQQLEVFFRQCPHPDEFNRRQIARGLGLDLTQVTSWFYNKMNQRKQEKLSNEVKAGGLLGRQSSSVGPDINLMNSHQHLIAAHRPIVLSEMQKKHIKIKVDQAFRELSLLSKANKPFWVRSMTNRGYVLHRKEYYKSFPKSKYAETRYRFESSKDLTLVPLKASDLARMFLDMNQWAELFPTIVNEAKILKSLDTGTRRASLHLMYGRMHILSPLVAPREFIFLRYCIQTTPTTWYIVDGSYADLLDVHALRHTLSWRYPSGVRIESLPDARSEVTWVEHVKVKRSLDQPLYGDLLSTVHGYGATRWLYTLQRMSERSLYSRSTYSHVLEEGIVEGRKNFMTLSLRMIRDFCSILSMPGNLSESSNPNVRMSIRNSSEPGQYRGMIIAASTSIRLPLTFENLFNFLRDENRRPEWDAMNNRTWVNKIKHMSTGAHPGDAISILQFVTDGNSCFLQESSIDPVGAFVIFTLVGFPKIIEIANGMDTRNIQILPCGFMISSDGASTSRGTTSRPSGSLLTLAFQWLLSDNTQSARTAAADNLNDGITSIIHDIRAALGCPQLD